MAEHWSPKPNARGSSPFFPVGVWPSGKAPVFGTGIKGSNPFTPGQSGGIGRHAGFRFQFI